MTDQPPAPPAPAPIGAPAPWGNVATIVVAAVTAIAELAAIHFGVETAAAQAIGNPIIAGCLLAYDAKGPR